MFSIGFTELLLVGTVSLVVMGPERLPSAVREATLWVNRIRRYVRKVNREIQEQIDGLENDRAFNDLQAGRKLLDDARRDLNQGVTTLVDYDEQEPPKDSRV